MDEKSLLRILKQEEADSSSYYDSELATAQARALDHYFARPYGDEAEGRSRVVSHDVEDTINWIMPDLMRCFASSDDLVSAKAMAPEDDNQYPGAPDGKSKADIVAAYLSHIYFEDNAGTEVTYDFLFDGLLQRLGIISVSWEDPEPEPPTLVEGVGVEQVLRYLEDPEYEILGHEEQEGPDGPSYSLELRRTPAMGRVHIEAVPPEEFRIHKGAKSIDTAKYHARKRLAYVEELARQHPEQAVALRERKPADGEPSDDGRYQARYPDDNVHALQTGGEVDEGRRECWLMEEYVRVDYDGDGIVELRFIKRVDDIILQNIDVTHSQFTAWTPSRVAHRVVGRSIDDMIADLQKIRTVITRAYLDGLQQTVTPRTYVNTLVIDQDGLDALADNQIGGIIPGKGPVRDAVHETVSPDVSGPCLQALEYFDQTSQVASGVTKHAQGMDPTALNKTATGIDLLQAAAKTRVEMIARWAGVALEGVFKNILRLVVAHQDRPRMVKLFGQWVELDPRTWSDEMAVKIDVGSAGVSKQQRIAHLMQIAAKQEQVLQVAGPTPLVTLEHLRNSYVSMASDMGFPDPSRFFGEIPPDWQPPEPQPDPKVVEAQGRLQLEGQKMQAQLQLEQQKQQADQEATTLKFASERELALIKAESEREIAVLRMTSEAQLARERMAQEMQLARERADMEMALAERDLRLKAEIGLYTAKAKSSGDSKGRAALSSHRPGGDLAK